jgi:N-acetylglucosaminyl-diphospho-decaprenol L-rhamnosyltransferase
VNAQQASTPVVDVVVVNWNTGDHLRECLRSISRAEHAAFVLGAVAVVDNGSTDGSLEGIDDLPLPLRVVRNSQNRGFAAACNQGATNARGDLILFLNPDTQLFPDALDRTVAFIVDPYNAAIGMCGAQMVGRDGSCELSCSRFPTLWMYLAKMFGLAHAFPRWIPNQRMAAAETAESRAVDQVIGAYLLIRRSVFELLVGFDERFFVYFEDVDLAYRAKQLGYTSYFLRDARVLHSGGVSSTQVRGRRLFYLLRSRTEYARKHWPRWQARLLAALTFAIELPARMLLAALPGDGTEVSEIVEAAKLYARYLHGEASRP